MGKNDEPINIGQIFERAFPKGTPTPTVLDDIALLEDRLDALERELAGYHEEVEDASQAHTRALRLVGSMAVSASMAGSGLFAYLIASRVLGTSDQWAIGIAVAWALIWSIVATRNVTKSMERHKSGPWWAARFH